MDIPLSGQRTRVAGKQQAQQISGAALTPKLRQKE
jgi:hypothetical protein